MRAIITIVVSISVIWAQSMPLGAWGHANRFGGATAHRFGATAHTNRFGGSWAHARGVGTAGTTRYGGTATHAWGGGATATTRYGGTATHYAGGGWTATGHNGVTAAGDYDHYLGGAYGWGYHPPAVVHSYYGAGCYACGGWAAAGAAAAGAGVSLAAAHSAKESAAYSAGNAAAASVAPTYTMGAIYTVLPPRCATPDVHGETYYLCGNTWFQPAYGANGVHYRVVPAP